MSSSSSSSSSSYIGSRRVLPDIQAQVHHGSTGREVASYLRQGHE